jgi:hypothetical protein
VTLDADLGAVAGQKWTEHRHPLRCRRGAVQVRTAGGVQPSSVALPSFEVAMIPTMLSSVRIIQPALPVTAPAAVSAADRIDREESAD